MKVYIIILLSLLSAALIFSLGYMFKECEQCYIEKPKTQKNYEKENEIKREVEKKLNDIPNATIDELDSLWSDYRRRYKDDF